MAEPAGNSIEEYKAFVRDLKGKIRRLQDKNKELATEVITLRGGDGKNKAEYIQFALKFQNQVIKIQKAWRGFRARRQFQKLIAAANKDPQQKGPKNTNLSVMQRAKEAAEELNLTLEGIYRAADTSMKGDITLDEFRLFIKKINLKLSPAQMARYSRIMN